MLDKVTFDTFEKDSATRKGAAFVIDDAIYASKEGVKIDYQAVSNYRGSLDIEEGASGFFEGSRPSLMSPM